jgi:hypothetical protein
MLLVPFIAFSAIDRSFLGLDPLGPDELKEAQGSPTNQINRHRHKINLVFYNILSWQMIIYGRYVPAK